MSPKLKHLFLEDYSQIDTVIDAAKNQKHFFQLMDADKLLSEVQIIVAMDHVERNNGNSKVKKKENLLLMFIAGTTQISRAISLLGLNGSTRRIIAVYESESEMSSFLGSFPCLKESPARFIPLDNREVDHEVFSRISRVELSL